MASLSFHLALIGLLLGIFLPLLLPALPQSSLCWLLAPVAGLFLIVRRFHFLACFVAGVLLALDYGWDWQSRRLAEDCERRPMRISGYVASLPRVSEMPDGTLRQRFEFRVTHLPQHCGRPARVLLSAYDEPVLIPGGLWHLEVSLRRPWGLANPGSFNMQDWFAQTGIDAVGKVREMLPWDGAPPFAVSHHRLRSRIATAIRELGLAPRAQALLLAVTVADRSDIGPALWQRLQAFGLNHLLVVSGLHVGMVAGLGFLLGGCIQRFLALFAGSLPWLLALPALNGLALALTYAALAGFSLSTQRAALMVTVFALMSLSGRRVSAWTSLLVAAVVLSVLNPLAWLGSGAWLSFGSVALLLWLGQWRANRQASGRLSALLKVHLAMSLLMVPLGAWWFGGFSLVAALANLLLVPAVAFYLVPLALAGLMAWLCGATAIAGGCWRLAAWPLEGVLGTLDAIEESHSELLYRHLQARLLPVILAVAGLALGLLPGEWRSKVVASVLVLPLVIGLRHPSRSSDRFSLTVLDVGQGTAVVIESGERALLYDTGGGDPAGLNMAGSVVLPYLRHAGITELEQVVVSHADTDHSAGLPLLQQSIPIGELWLNRPRPGLESGPCRAGVSWRWPDGVEFRFLGPAARPPPSENDASCVLQVSVDGRRFLLPGDISKGQERDLLRYWQSEVESEWLLAGHHGSNTSTAASWLRRVGPLEVVYGRGFGNPFGHPHPAVAGRVARWGATVGDTALQGAVSYRLGPDGAWRRVAHRDTRRRYWLH